MIYKDAVEACKKGMTVTDGVTTGTAKRIVILWGKDHINTDAPGRMNNIEVEKARVV